MRKSLHNCIRVLLQGLIVVAFSQSSFAERINRAALTESSVENPSYNRASGRLESERLASSIRRRSINLEDSSTPVEVEVTNYPGDEGHTVQTETEDGCGDLNTDTSGGITVIYENDCSIVTVGEDIQSPSQIDIVNIEVTNSTISIEDANENCAAGSSDTCTIQQHWGDWCSANHNGDQGDCVDDLSNGTYGNNISISETVGSNDPIIISDNDSEQTDQIIIVTGENNIIVEDNDPADGVPSQVTVDCRVAGTSGCSLRTHWQDWCAAHRSNDVGTCVTELSGGTYEESRVATYDCANASSIGTAGCTIEDHWEAWCARHSSETDCAENLRNSGQTISVRSKSFSRRSTSAQRSATKRPTLNIRQVISTASSERASGQVQRAPRDLGAQPNLGLEAQGIRTFARSQEEAIDVLCVLQAFLADQCDWKAHLAYLKSLKL